MEGNSVCGREACARSDVTTSAVVCGFSGQWSVFSGQKSQEHGSLITGNCLDGLWLPSVENGDGWGSRCCGVTAGR
jgi:hypothetical protein